jgi:hypothetical protein
MFRLGDWGVTLGEYSPPPTRRRIIPRPALEVVMSAGEQGEVSSVRRLAFVRLAAAVIITAAAAVLLVRHTAERRPETLAELHSSWRYWDDLTIATARYVAWKEGPLRGDTRAPNLEDMTETYRRMVEREVHRDKIKPDEYWRTIEDKPFVKHRRPYELPRFEDPGRAIVLAAAFVTLGGVSPYLLIVLAAVAAVPVLLWLSLELADAGHLAAAAVFALAWPFSPYVIECLSLPHSAIGFYLIAVVAILALGVYAFLGRCRSVPLFAARVALASALFAVATICRSGTLLMLPAFLLAVLAAAYRVFGPAGTAVARAWVPASRLGKALAALALCAAFVAPYVLVRPAQYHNAWVSLWEGLGDFASERGYSWYDADAKRFLSDAGLEPFKDPKDVRPEHEALFRRVVLDDIRGEPLWYLGVLAKRTLATLGFTHLAPWGPRDGESLGRPRFHYKYTTPADWISWRGQDVELPVAWLWGPPAVLTAAFLTTLALRRRSPACAAAARRLGRMAAVLLVATLAVLPVPVLISTASALETQAFLFVCLAAMGFLADELLGALVAVGSIATARQRRTSSSDVGEVVRPPA